LGIAATGKDDEDAIRAQLIAWLKAGGATIGKDKRQTTTRKTLEASSVFETAMEWLAGCPISEVMKFATVQDEAMRSKLIVLKLQGDIEQIDADIATWKGEAP
jgi:hypothetical protein